MCRLFEWNKKNWDLIKGHSKRANVTFSDSENQDTKTKHFDFGFNSQNVSNFLLKFLYHINRR